METELLKRISAIMDTSNSVCDSLPSQPQRYKYHSLERPTTQIRVIQLLSEPGEGLKCRFSLNEVNTAHYTALSYEWGDPAKPFSIEVIGHSGKSEGVVPLTQNLHNALCSLRDSSEVTERTFWIDQLCINQDDTLERSQQVSLMARIYKNAARVISYLGPEKESDDTVIALIRQMHNQYSPLYNDPKVMPGSWSKTLLLFRDPTQIPQAWKPSMEIKEDMWPHIAKYLAGPTTRRLWMFQETCLNKNVWILRGRNLFPWDALAFIPLLSVLGITPFNKFESYDKSGLRLTTLTILRHRQLPQEQLRLCRLLHLILNPHFLQCSDPRDRIYALIGFACDTTELGIRPDYSLTNEEVLLDVALRMLKTKGQHMACLRAWNENCPEDTLLPSWVPRWNGYQHELWDPDGRCFSASKASTSRIRFQNKASILEISGLTLSTITETNGIINGNLDSSVGIAELDEFCKLERNVRSFLKNTKFGRAAFCYSLVVHSQWPDQASEETIDHGATAVEALLQAIKIMKDKISNGEIAEPFYLRQVTSTFSDAEQRRLAEFILFNISFARGRTICFTEDGRICLAPGHSQCGDIVTLFLGGPTIYVLRPKEEKFQYVGDAFIYGVMNGELLDTPGWEEKLQTFQII